MKAAHLLLGMALAAPLPPLAAQPIAASERPLGPGRAFTGVYATNFEIGYFVECDPTGGGCAGWRDQEARWLRWKAMGRCCRPFAAEHPVGFFDASGDGEIRFPQGQL